MALTLVIHRQWASLAEIFDGLLQGLHKILPANSGGTLDKSRFLVINPCTEKTLSPGRNEKWQPVEWVRPGQERLIEIRPKHFPGSRFDPAAIVRPRQPAPPAKLLPASFTSAEIRRPYLAACHQTIIPQWTPFEAAIGHVLTYVFHRQWESLAENPDRFARRSHKIMLLKSGKTIDKSRFSGNKSLR